MEVLYRFLVVVVFTLILQYFLKKVINTKKIHLIQEIEVFSLFFSLDTQLLCFKDITFEWFVYGIFISLAAYYIIYGIEWLISYIRYKGGDKPCSMFEMEADSYNKEEKRYPYYGFLRFFGKVYKK